MLKMEVGEPRDHSAEGYFLLITKWRFPTIESEDRNQRALGKMPKHCSSNIHSLISLILPILLG